MTVTLELYNLIATLVILAFVCFLAGVVVESRRGAMPRADYGAEMASMERFSATSTRLGQAKSNPGCSWFAVVFAIGALLLFTFMIGL